VKVLIGPDNMIGIERGVCNAAGRLLFAFLVSTFVFTCTARNVNAQAVNSCQDCHAGLDPPLKVTAEDYSSSIHAEKGLSCVSCHGGDASTYDPAQSMGRAAGFRGHIDRSQIPALCAKCHSDAAYMRGYNPSVRTDQFSQYQTSVHGKLLAKGDTHVAVCTDCHTSHKIHPRNDPQSSVYPLNVAQTCANCHANAEHMKAYKIPTDQFALYSTSVHHEALVVRGDLTAPTCSTCHGSHGAAPPGVDSVQRICSTCHVFQQQLFDSGPHKQAFALMNVPGCITCHSNHGIAHPSDAMIGTTKGAVCMKCHAAGDPGYLAAEALHASLTKLDAQIARSDELLARAENSGVEVGESQLSLAEARDDLTKARVTIHSVRADAVDENIQAGLKVTRAAWQAGLDAMAELRYRRTGLTVSLGAILLVLVVILLLIRSLESKKSNATKGAG
jgi:predicted CXXCH cytochrome family protein